MACDDTFDFLARAVAAMAFDKKNLQIITKCRHALDRGRYIAALIAARNDDGGGWIIEPGMTL